MPSIKAGTVSGVSSKDLWIHCTCASQVGITYIYIYEKYMYLYKYKIRKKAVLSCKEVQTLN